MEHKHAEAPPAGAVIKAETRTVHEMTMVNKALDK